MDRIDAEVSYKQPINFSPFFVKNLPLSFKDAIVDFCIFCHHAAKNIRNGTLICPRQYIEFILRFVDLFLEKKSQMEDRQRHLIVGLDRLQETFIKVKDLRSSLDAKKTKLESKTSLANEKLRKMVNWFIQITGK